MSPYRSERPLGPVYNRIGAVLRLAEGNDWTLNDWWLNCPVPHISGRANPEQYFVWIQRAIQPTGQRLVSRARAHTCRYRTETTTWPSYWEGIEAKEITEAKGFRSWRALLLWGTKCLKRYYEQRGDLYKTLLGRWYPGRTVRLPQTTFQDIVHVSERFVPHHKLDENQSAYSIFIPL